MNGMGGWKLPLPRSTSWRFSPSGICWMRDILLALSSNEVTISRLLNELWGLYRLGGNNLAGDEVGCSQQARRLKGCF
jgi:hypothetical protein